MYLLVSVLSQLLLIRTSGIIVPIYIILRTFTALIQRRHQLVSILIYYSFRWVMGHIGLGPVRLPTFVRLYEQSVSDHKSYHHKMTFRFKINRFKRLKINSNRYPKLPLQTYLIFWFVSFMVNFVTEYKIKLYT